MTQQITDYDVITAMERYGGGFASNLAKACFHADIQNLAKIKLAFQDLWGEYAEMAEITDYDVIIAMERYGGGFASRLAKAALHADDKNLATLKQAFPELWRQYEIVAKKTRGERT